MWYAHGDVIDGCSRQPIAAVRSETSVRNIVLKADAVLRSKLSLKRVTHASTVSRDAFEVPNLV